MFVSRDVKSFSKSSSLIHNGFSALVVLPGSAAGLMTTIHVDNLEDAQEVIVQNELKGEFVISRNVETLAELLENTCEDEKSARKLWVAINLESHMLNIIKDFEGLAGLQKEVKDRVTCDRPNKMVTIDGILLSDVSVPLCFLSLYTPKGNFTLKADQRVPILTRQDMKEFEDLAKKRIFPGSFGLLRLVRLCQGFLGTGFKFGVDKTLSEDEQEEVRQAYEVFVLSEENRDAVMEICEKVSSKNAKFKSEYMNLLRNSDVKVDKQLDDQSKKSMSNDKYFEFVDIHFDSIVRPATSLETKHPFTMPGHENLEQSLLTMDIKNSEENKRMYCVTALKKLSQEADEEKREAQFATMKTKFVAAYSTKETNPLYKFFQRDSIRGMYITHMPQDPLTLTEQKLLTDFQKNMTDAHGDWIFPENGIEGLGFSRGRLNELALSHRFRNDLPNHKILYFLRQKCVERGIIIPSPTPSWTEDEIKLLRKSRKQFLSPGCVETKGNWVLPDYGFSQVGIPLPRLRKLVMCSKHDATLGSQDFIDWLKLVVPVEKCTDVEKAKLKLFRKEVCGNEVVLKNLVFPSTWYQDLGINHVRLRELIQLAIDGDKSVPYQSFLKQLNDSAKLVE